jgi:hypothetical protein
MYNDVLTKYNLAKNWSEKDPLLTRCFNLADFFIMDQKNSNDPVIPADYKYGGMLQRCYDLTIFGTYTDRDLVKATVTPMLNQIQKYFADKLDPTKKIPLKYVHYSGHDDTIGSHMVAIEIGNPKCVLNALLTGKDESFEACPHHPYTSSNVIWELVEGVNGTTNPGVKVSYNGDYLDYC